MAFPVICISHTDGSGGESVGSIVAEALGYRLLNEEIIQEAARLAHVDPSQVAAAERKQSLLQRVLDSLAGAQDLVGVAPLGAGLLVPLGGESLPRTPSKEDMRGMIRAAIFEVSRYGKVVLVTHAASMALAGRPGVLRVLVTAPAEVRTARLAEARSLTAQAARDAIAAGDRGRRDYLKSFYGIDEEAPTHYDLVVNTEQVTAHQAADLVVATANMA